MTDQVVTVEDGKIYWRGVYKPLPEALKLMDHFTNYEDWFKPQAQNFAIQLAIAITETTKDNF
jgi:hypothetical protein